MRNAFLSAGIGLTLGVVSTLAYISQSSKIPFTSRGVASPIVIDSMSVDNAAVHREQHYRDIDSVEATVRLPTHFARLEAMYVLAGRSDSENLQRHLFDANRIADYALRTDALRIFFFRMTELDPRSALALARSSPFNTQNDRERQVWTQWARQDLDSAISAAKTEKSIRKRRFAAQAMFAAHGHMGNATTDRIAEDLQVKPNRNNRSAFMKQMVSESIPRTIAYINSLPPGQEQRDLVGWLAQYVSNQDLESPSYYSHLIQNPQLRKRYDEYTDGSELIDDPKAVLIQVVAEGRGSVNSRIVDGAISALPREDLHAAISLLPQLKSSRDRTLMVGAIAHEFVEQDPAAAIVWARENDALDDMGAQSSVISALARSKPDMAVSFAMEANTAEQRESLVREVMQIAGQDDPEYALQMVSELPQGSVDQHAKVWLFGEWVQGDAKRAVAWALEQDEEIRDHFFESTSTYHFYSRDLQETIDVLDMLPVEHSASLRAQVATQMATDRSHLEAIEFVRQFEGESGYAHAYASVLRVIATEDELYAMELIQQLPRGDTRDATIHALVAERQTENPDQALHFAAKIEEPTLRESAVSDILRYSFHDDPDAAVAWLEKNSANPAHDRYVAVLASTWRNPSQKQLSLVFDINDAATRRSAVTNLVEVVAYVDSTKAEQLLMDAELPEYDRQRLEAHIARVQNRL